MPDGDDTNDYPERLLAGSDRPRPLPTHLRARLEEALEGVATTSRPDPCLVKCGTNSRSACGPRRREDRERRGGSGRPG